MEKNLIFFSSDFYWIGSYHENNSISLTSYSLFINFFLRNDYDSEAFNVSKYVILCSFIVFPILIIYNNFLGKLEIFWKWLRLIYYWFLRGVNLSSVLKRLSDLRLPSNSGRFVFTSLVFVVIVFLKTFSVYKT